MTPTSSGTLRLRDETDVLAFVPYCFGFHPEESLVMLCTDGSRTFHARIDLPEDPEDVPLVVEQLVEPARRNRARQVLVLAYTTRRAAGAEACAGLSWELSAHGISTLLQLLVADGCFWRLDPETGRPVEPGSPYDLGSHPLAARAVLEGTVTYGSRAELAASLDAGDPVRREEVVRALEALPPLARRRRAALEREGRWLLGETRAQLDQAGDPSPGPAARVLRGLADRELRDVVWAAITAEEATGHSRWWRRLVRVAPDSHVAEPAALLAFSAWLAGHGALAWCGVERALAVDPHHVLARLVHQALDGAVPPSAWRPVDPHTLRSGAG